MKDSFIFEGKKFISARRASEISDYSSDYIGQLCRGGKLECRMIGRAWFVAEESLHLHKASVLHDEIYRNRIQNLRGGKKSKKDLQQQEVVEAQPVEIAASEVAESVVAIPAEQIYTYSVDSVQSNVTVNEPVASEASSASTDSTVSECVPEATVAEPIVPVLVRGVEDEQKIAAQEAAAPVARPLEVTHIVVHEVDEAEPVHISAKKTYPEISRNIILRRVLTNATLAVVVIGLFVGGITLVASRSSTLASANGSASVIDSLSSFTSFLGEQVRSVLAIFSAPNSNHLTMNEPTTEQTSSNGSSVTDVGTNSSANQGMAVAPSTGTSAGDAALKQKIQDSFSDQVEVHPDQSGTTGVVKPVFRNATGKDFVYVMVPLNPAPPVSNQSGASPP